MGLSASTTNASFVSPSMTTQMGSSTMVTYKLQSRKTYWNAIQLIFSLSSQGRPSLFKICLILYCFANILDQWLLFVLALALKFDCSKWTIFQTEKVICVRIRLISPPRLEPFPQELMIERDPKSLLLVGKNLLMHWALCCHHRGNRTGLFVKEELFTVSITYSYSSFFFIFL